MSKFWLCQIDGLIEGCFSSPSEARDYMCELVLSDNWGASAFELNIIETKDDYEPESEVLDAAAIAADWIPQTDGEVLRIARSEAVTSDMP